MAPQGVPKAVFVDTAAWVALLNKSDDYHSQAVSIHQTLLQSGKQLITTELVFAETGGSFSKASFHTIVHDLRSSFISVPRYRLIAPSKEVLNQGWSMFRQYNDKDWSLVDCVSFVVMKKFNLKHAFTFDHHFRQAGFEILSP